jgi:branched-chain amino acid aminotransferase
LVVGTKLITPPVSEGCLNGVMKNSSKIVKKSLEVVEEIISPFDLQKQMSCLSLTL